MRAASQKIRHVHLKLGGKAPVIVFEDADLDAVAETIRYGSYFNAGQDCAQPCRVIAQKGIYDDLVARIEAQVKEIQIGAQKAEGTEMGPIVSDEQRARIAALVDRARDTCDVVKGDARVMVRDISMNPPFLPM
jgi:aminobutyraldehyde dehydrogenase